LVGSSLDPKKNTNKKNTAEQKKNVTTVKHQKLSASDSFDTNTFIKHESPCQQENLREAKIDEFIVAK